MLIRLQEIWRDEGGAVTVDWVVLTAGVVGLGALMYFYLEEPIQNIDESTGQALAGVEVQEISFD
ncbi:MAG: hypothetical protein AB3N07_05465 [Ruegeria sp.]|uniref:hypothetical protein n=1 Tax=Ruegeria sp. ANG-S4 TaxID=1577904 RepID=UPI00057EBF25|nr:hypothetical protein [Ruegeria sp. ANG-S4]KIC43750.1 hypothetical protein RA28_19115 [Ruegeria sp. ANG-S4]